MSTFFSRGHTNDCAAVDFIDIDDISLSDELKILAAEIVNYLFENEKKHFDEFIEKPEDHIYFKLQRLKELSGS